MHSDGMSMIALRNSKPVYVCPITKGCKTRISDFPTYSKLCEYYQKQISNAYLEASIGMCSTCKNKGVPKETLHNASLLTFQELLPIIDRFDKKQHKAKS